MFTVFILAFLDPVLVENEKGAVLPTNPVEHEGEQAAAAVDKGVIADVSQSERVGSFSSIGVKRFPCIVFGISTKIIIIIGLRRRSPRSNASQIINILFSIRILQ